MLITDPRKARIGLVVATDGTTLRSLRDSAAFQRAFKKITEKRQGKKRATWRYELSDDEGSQSSISSHNESSVEVSQALLPRTKLMAPVQKPSRVRRTHTPVPQHHASVLKPSRVLNPSNSMPRQSHRQPALPSSSRAHHGLSSNTYGALEDDIPRKRLYSRDPPQQHWDDHSQHPWDHDYNSQVSKSTKHTSVVPTRNIASSSTSAHQRQSLHHVEKMKKLEQRLAAIQDDVSLGQSHMVSHSKASTSRSHGEPKARLKVLKGRDPSFRKRYSQLRYGDWEDDDLEDDDTVGDVDEGW